jgi:SAM-dependent methyltransferase
VSRYDRYYGEVASSFSQLRLDREKEINLMVDSLIRRLSPPGRLLDIGCGTGRYGVALRRAGFSVTGIDSSQAQLDHAVALDGTICASSTDVPLAQETVDVCILVLMLQQLTASEQIATLRECLRLLRPGGLLGIKTCSREDLARRPFNDVFPSAFALNVGRYPSIDFLSDALEEGGWEAIELEHTHTVQMMTAEELLAATEGRHNTTLMLIPGDELTQGVARLKAELDTSQPQAVPHFHTLIFARRPVG